MLSQVERVHQLWHCDCCQDIQDIRKGKRNDQREAICPFVGLCLTTTLGYSQDLDSEYVSPLHPVPRGDRHTETLHYKQLAQSVRNLLEGAFEINVLDSLG